MTGLAAVPTSPGEHPFCGLAIAETAGLRLLPGSPRAVFDQDRWDLTGLADAPAVMSRYNKILDFTAITNPRWRMVAKQYLLARLAPQHPAVSTLPHAFRAPLNPHSLRSELTGLTSWFNHLTGAGVTAMGQVEQRHCDTYLTAVSDSSTKPGRPVSPATIVVRLRIPKHLSLYTELLSDGYRPGFAPWAERSIVEVVGYHHPRNNQVPPVPDALLRPLLSGSLYLLDTIGPHLVVEADAARTADHRTARRLRKLRVDDLDDLRDTIEQRRQAGIPAYRAHTHAVTRRLHDGWDPEDPLLDMAWQPLVAETVAAISQRRHLETLRPELHRWVAECGLEQPWGRDAALVARHDDGEPIPWTRPLSRPQLNNTIYAVTSAAFCVTSALSGMRASELAELRGGCRRETDRPAGGRRFHLVTRRIKGETFGGVDDEWVVINDVHRAIGLAETLTGAGPGQRLFARASNTSSSRCDALRSWINGEAGRRLGLDPIAPGPINPRALRRTLAITIAARPHGLMAAKVQLKHLSVATTEGYTACPGGHQAAFAAEVAAEEHAEAQRLTAAAYHDYQRGVLPTGQGARDLITAFQAAEQALNRHDPGPVTVIDDRRLERVLQATAKTLHVGVGNYCWFTDPSKALCLKLAGTPEADAPLIGMCDSARCSQATHHPGHRQTWADHAEHTTTVFLGNPRLSAPERARAQAAVDRATRVVAEIDAGQPSEGDGP